MQSSSYMYNNNNNNNNNNNLPEIYHPLGPPAVIIGIHMQLVSIFYRRAVPAPFRPTYQMMIY